MLFRSLPETGGISAYAIPITTGEIGIGITQMLDAFSNHKASEDDLIHKSSSIPGLVAYYTKTEYAPYIDATGQFIPGMLSGGNIVGGFKSAYDAVFRSPTVSWRIFNALSAVDAYMDTQGLELAAGTVARAKAAQPKLTGVNKQMSPQQIESIKNFVKKLH